MNPSWYLCHNRPPKTLLQMGLDFGDFKIDYLCQFELKKRKKLLEALLTQYFKKIKKKLTLSTNLATMSQVIFINITQVDYKKNLKSLLLFSVRSTYLVMIFLYFSMCIMPLKMFFNSFLFFILSLRSVKIDLWPFFYNFCILLWVFQ